MAVLFISVYVPLQGLSQNQDQAVKSDEKSDPAAVIPATQPVNAEQKSEPPASADTINRVPVSDIFDTKKYEVESVADSLEYDKGRGLLIAKGNVFMC